MLAQAGQRIKDRAFARIRIPGKGNHIVPILHVHTQLEQIGCVMGWTTLTSLILYRHTIFRHTATADLTIMAFA